MKDTYIARRKQLMENKKENTAVVIFSGSAPMKSQDEAYPFSFRAQMSARAKGRLCGR